MNTYLLGNKLSSSSGKTDYLLRSTRFSKELGNTYPQRHESETTIDPNNESLPAPEVSYKQRAVKIFLNSLDSVQKTNPMWPSDITSNLMLLCEHGSD